MSWQIIAFLSLAFFSVCNVFLKLVGGKVPPLFIIPLMTIGTIIACLVFWLFARLTGTTFIPISQESVLFATLAGIFWAIGQALFFLMLSKNIPFSIAMTIFTVSAAIMSYAIGVFFFKDVVRPVNFIGLVVAILGLVLLSL